MGFDKMTPEKRQEIARLGGLAAWQQGKAHKFKAGKKAREAGRKGGKVTQALKAAKKKQETPPVVEQPTQEQAGGEIT